METQRTHTLLIAGPTGGGKSALAVEVAQSFSQRGEIVSADSMQLYRGMNIGTAKATPLEQSRVAHHMIDCADPHHDAPTVADWLAGAERAISEIHQRGHVALVVGGTNLYLRAMIDGLFDGPPQNAPLRAELEATDLDVLRIELDRVDPQAAQRIHRNDRRRTIRAIEVARLSGQSITSLQTQWSGTMSALAPGVRLVGLDWTAPHINSRINARVREMMSMGFLDEVAALRAVGPLTRQASGAVGYLELWRHLDGDQPLSDAVESIGIRSRKYAKQQRTWFRRMHLIPDSVWVDAADPASQDRARTVIRNWFQ
ncbi:MAG: tRNA (adenosine(37)-N6)-dimethylallyltransferase MiaA [Planctomycetota bacterium]|nr:tRNA (adenosine(37)-N6)-dimethylallyltransferase MiaA [Planctomycetota bacterium]